MKKLDFIRLMGNIDEKYVSESENYRARPIILKRVVALAACIAILVTSTITAFVWDKEDPASHDHGNQVGKDTSQTGQDIIINKLPDNIKGFGNIPLSNATLDFDFIKLNNGKIDLDSDVSDPNDVFVFEYTDDYDEKAEFIKMVTRALPYHNMTSFEANSYNDVAVLGDTQYWLHQNNNIVDKRILCSNKFFGTTPEEMYAKACEMEQYVTDVFGITAFTDSYSYYPNPLHEGFEHPGMLLAIRLEPTDDKDHQNEVVKFALGTTDGINYHLYQIIYNYNLGGDRYVRLLSPEDAIEKLADGEGIGDAGQGCYICRENYHQKVVNNIQKYMTWEIVVISDIPVKTKDGEKRVDLPFYRFTSKPDANGESYVSYVIATYDHSNTNIEIDVDALDRLIKDYNLMQCPNAADHDRIKEEKVVRTNKLKEEYVATFPDEEKSRASKLAGMIYKW